MWFIIHYFKFATVTEMTSRTMRRSVSKSLVTEWNTGSRSMNPGASVQQGMQLALMRQAGARHGSRENAALGIQEGSLTLYVIINYSPMQKQFSCTKRSTRWPMNSCCCYNSWMIRLTLHTYEFDTSIIHQLNTLSYLTVQLGNTANSFITLTYWKYIFYLPNEFHFYHDMHDILNKVFWSCRLFKKEKSEYP